MHTTLERSVPRDSGALGGRALSSKYHVERQRWGGPPFVTTAKHHLDAFLSIQFPRLCSMIKKIIAISSTHISISNSMSSVFRRKMFFMVGASSLENSEKRSSTCDEIPNRGHSSFFARRIPISGDWTLFFETNSSTTSKKRDRSVRTKGAYISSFEYKCMFHLQQ